MHAHDTCTLLKQVLPFEVFVRRQRGSKYDIYDGIVANIIGCEVGGRGLTIEYNYENNTKKNGLRYLSKRMITSAENRSMMKMLNDENSVNDLEASIDWLCYRTAYGYFVSLDRLLSGVVLSGDELINTNIMPPRKMLQFSNNINDSGGINTSSPNFIQRKKDNKIFAVPKSRYYTIPPKKRISFAGIHKQGNAQVTHVLKKMSDTIIRSGLAV